MNEDQGKGKLDQLKGDVKERIGGASKDRSLEGEGAWDRAKGKVREAVGDVKEKFKDEKRERDVNRDDPDAI
ncbi:MAG: CsbD family protein [Anaeromyxobacteraceae bacterium]